MFTFRKYRYTAISLPLFILAIITASAYAPSFGYTFTKLKAVKLQPHIKPPFNKVKKKSLQGSPVISYAPKDITVNACGNSTTLTPPADAPTPPNFANLMWSDGSTKPTLTVNGKTGQTTTYWWQKTGPNQVQNGSFTYANTAINTEYGHYTTTPKGSNPDEYTVNTNASDFNSMFDLPAEHTSNGGNMLIVDGSLSKAIVWYQTISITANTDYVFSAWAANATYSSPTLNFSIVSNGNTTSVVSDVTLYNYSGTWQYLSGTWHSDNTGTAVIKIVDDNTDKGGNDFAIDDIVFAPVYRQNFIVNYNALPVIDVPATASVCTPFDFTKIVKNYDAAKYTYKVIDPSGNAVSNISAITAGGTYNATAKNIITGCESSPQSVNITTNPQPDKLGINAQ
jgi:hypothetical protein